MQGMQQVNEVDFVTTTTQLILNTLIYESGRWNFRQILLQDSEQILLG